MERLLIYLCLASFLSVTVLNITTGGYLDRSTLLRTMKTFRCDNGKQILPAQVCDGILDCVDGKDENNFTLCATRPRACTREEFTCVNRKCVPMARQCNLEDDCGDMSDEMGCNLSGTCNDNTCAHGCSPGIGNGAKYLCHCAQGFKVGSDHRSCEDIDECSSFQVHHCPQLCENTAGSFSCRCKRGFVWLHYRCLATGSPPVLVYAFRSKLLQYYNNNFQFFMHGVATIRALDMDPLERTVYWVDSDNMLKRSLVPNISASAPTSGKEQILAESTKTTTGISIDWVARNVYWATVAHLTDPEAGSGQIRVSTIDGRHMKILVWDNVQAPAAIAVSPEIGQMVWTEAGCSPRLEAAWMDGSHRKVLVHTNIRKPTGVTIDYHMSNRIFWCDQGLNRIESINIDGGDRVEVASGDELQFPVRLDVVGLTLYWSTLDSHKIVRLDKFGRGAQVTVTTHVSSVTDFRVYQSLKQDVNLYNPCHKKSCSHLCLLNPMGAVCACPEGTYFRRFTRKVCDADLEPARSELQRCSCKADQVCKVDIVTQELYCI